MISPILLLFSSAAFRGNVADTGSTVEVSWGASGIRVVEPLDLVSVAMATGSTQ